MPAPGLLLWAAVCLLATAPAAWQDWRQRTVLLWQGAAWCVLALPLAAGRLASPEVWWPVEVAAGLLLCASMLWLGRTAHMGSGDVLYGIPLWWASPPAWLGGLAVAWLWYVGRRLWPAGRGAPGHRRVPMVTCWWVAALGLWFHASRRLWWP